MFKVNIDIQDRQINDQTGNIIHTEFAQGKVCKVYVKFSDEQTGLKAIISSWVPIEKCESEISIKRGSTNPSIKCNQFPLMGMGIYCSKLQNLSLEQGAIDFDL